MDNEVKKKKVNVTNLTVESSEREGFSWPPPPKKKHLCVGNTKCSYLKGFVYPSSFLRILCGDSVSVDIIPDLLKDNLASFHYTLVFIMSWALPGLEFFPFILFNPQQYCYPMV